MTLCRPPPSPIVLRRPLSSSVVLYRPLSSSVVLRRPLSSSVVPAVFRCFPMYSAVFRRPLPSPAVLCGDLPSPGRSCLGWWGSSSLLMTAVLGIRGRNLTTFCYPVSSGGLGSHPPGPTGHRPAENTGHALAFHEWVLRSPGLHINMSRLI